MHVAMLNAVNLVLRYRSKDCSEEVLKKLLESAATTLQCKWPGKQEAYSSQKYPPIIEAISQLCILLSEKFPTCTF